MRENCILQQNCLLTVFFAVHFAKHLALANSVEVFQVFVRREASVEGPLPPLKIKDLVIQKYVKVSSVFM